MAHFVACQKILDQLECFISNKTTFPIIPWGRFDDIGFVNALNAWIKHQLSLMHVVCSSFC